MNDTAGQQPEQAVVDGGGGRRISVSDDRRELTIESEQGHRAVYRSARPDGFTEADLVAAHAVAFSARISGQVNRSRQLRVGPWVVDMHVNTGPPTWWRPRMEIGADRVLAGWLRMLVAVVWERSQPSASG
ncbi:hypothetical protein QRB38_13280 [Mycobacterium avium subsp. hominissuis]|uniref:hypothetical protein n=1 Tax=Mycobacterium avium TaxID=1764 RepID=UPI0026660849|nr:hypothetical protein [Mycobacterium avium]MDO2394783.1 hypothetical protein [Mycobacterium avium subsp. hominissuis]